MGLSGFVTDGIGERIERAESEFASGDLTHAAELLSDALADPDATTAQRAEILNDLAVIASATGDTNEAEAHLLAALACDLGFLPALENLAAWCANQADLVQQTHWARRAAEAAPGERSGWWRLARVLLARRRYDEARTELLRLDALGDDVCAELAGIDRRLRGPEPPPASGAGGRSVDRVLIVVDYFYPSVGGSERLAEAAGAALSREGITVEIATRRLAHRTSLVHRSMVIHEVDDDPAARLRALLSAGRYDAMVIFSAPTSWPMIASLGQPVPRPRIVAVPCINAENSESLRRDPRLLRTYAELIATADGVGYSSYCGPDVRLCEDLGLPGVYLPNASEYLSPVAGAAPPACGDGRPLLLTVGNMWHEKNHAGLLRALRAEPGDWRLAIIGDASPVEPDLAVEVRRLAAEDPRVELLGPASPAAVAAAMDEAQILLLPSLAEATPLVLLEAMSHQLPWIATPTCGAAHDHAGGLILALERFGDGIRFLLENPEAAASLGAAGRAHWRQCYTWEVVGARYARLLRGEALCSLHAPAAAVWNTEQVRSEYYDRRPAEAVRRSGAD